MSSAIQVTAIDYPESDGRPMGETDLHRDAMVRHIELLKYHFRGQRVYVSGDLLVYYEQGNPKKFVVPDAFAAKGLEPKKRRVYKIWTEGKAPDAVIETTSRKTKKQDTVAKPELYARLGIKEYFLFDPTQDYLDPPLQGYRLDGQQYLPIATEHDGALVSEQFVLRFKVEHQELQFYDLTSGERLLTAEERVVLETEGRQAEAKARQAEAKARRAEARARRAEVRARQAEAKARQAAEAELERLREELRRRDRDAGD